MTDLSPQEHNQWLYDQYLRNGSSVKKTAEVTRIAYNRIVHIVKRMSDKHIAAVKKMHDLKHHVIRDQEVLERYFYNPKYPVTAKGEVINHE